MHLKIQLKFKIYGLVLVAIMLPAEAIAGELFSFNFGRRDTNEIRSRSLFRGGSRGYFDGRLGNVHAARSSTASLQALNPFGRTRSITDIFSGTRSSGRLQDVNPFEANRLQFLRAQEQYLQKLKAWKFGGPTTSRGANLRNVRNERESARQERLKQQQIARVKRKAELDQRSRSRNIFESRPDQSVAGQQPAVATAAKGQTQSQILSQPKTPHVKQKQEQPTFIGRIRAALFG